ncbi:ER lumen protein retaining receptor [Macleaya cordata]|uniref:ER lumen protein-retaining receptor n=1 Tax=Macleaya cordata TaxID=56857 RepID=A0A200QPL7_MACCD|nr:ER lumen protein retaining receptor [Macleaya cordata]
MVFLARYLDLFTDFISIYNTVMKIVFIASSLAIVWCMRVHRVVKRSYDKELDTFRHYFLVLGCFVLALLVNEKFTFQEIFWAFSLYLEAVAILPQLVLLQRSGNVDNLTGQYVFFLGYGSHFETTLTGYWTGVGYGQGPRDPECFEGIEAYLELLARGFPEMSYSLLEKHEMLYAPP